MTNHISLLDKTYDGESIAHVARDVSGAFSRQFTPAFAKVPCDTCGIHYGTFKVRIDWRADSDIPSKEERLISAGPEMIEMLVIARSLYRTLISETAEHFQDLEQVETRRRVLQRRSDRIDATLAKATGETA